MARQSLWMGGIYRLLSEAVFFLKPTAMNEPQNSRFTGLPSVDRLLSSEHAEALVKIHGRPEVKHGIQVVLQSVRAALQRGEVLEVSEASIFMRVDQAFDDDNSQRLRRVFNLSGTILHTNLGRALLPKTAIDVVTEVMRSPTNLEYDIRSGRRGSRDDLLENKICRLTGAEAATVVNNNAAAVMLVLNTLALDKQVPVSRGELVEIGGSFRVPDIMAQSGCELVEVGTTNRTHLSDYASALNSETALIMRVHQSNYVIQGFTAAVEDKALAKISNTASIPFVVDLGSGTLVNLEDYGLPHEPTPMDSLKKGADLVTFSGDKLLGGPQAGIIVGRRDLIEKLNANPMKRALRCDKMTIAALSALLKLYNHADRLPEQLPVLRMMVRSKDEIKAIASKLMPLVEQRLNKMANVSLIECESEIGSGALPDRTIPSIGISIQPHNTAQIDEQLSNIAKAFRMLPTPVIGRIHKGTFILDCRCLEETEEFLAQLGSLNLSA